VIDSGDRERGPVWTCDNGHAISPGDEFCGRCGAYVRSGDLSRAPEAVQPGSEPGGGQAEHATEYPDDPLAEYTSDYTSGSFAEFITATSETDIPPFLAEPLPGEVTPDAYWLPDAGAPGPGAPAQDEPDVAALSAPERVAAGYYYRRDEPEDPGRELSGDGTDTPVSGFRPLLRVPDAPPAERPAPPGPRVAPPGERVLPPAEWAPRSAPTASPSEERAAPPGEWHLPARPSPAPSDGTADGDSAGNGRAANEKAGNGSAGQGDSGHGRPGRGAPEEGTWGPLSEVRIGDGDDDGPGTPGTPARLGAPLAETGYRRPSRTRLLAGVAAVAILGVTGVTGTLVVMHQHQSVASVPATTSAAASGISSQVGVGEAGSARPTPPAPRWSSPVPVDPQTLQASGTHITGLACPKRTVCYATDSAGTVLSLQSGGTWPVATTDPQGGLIAISCASARFCLTVDGAGYAIPLNQGVWGAPALVGSGSGTLTRVSCAGPYFCEAVDNIGNAFTYRGPVTGWSQQAVDPSGQSLNSISCPSSTYCVAVSASGSAFTFNGTSWGGPALVDMGHDLVSVSCPTTSFCMAVDSSGQAAEHSDGLWGLQPVEAAPAAVSCPSAGSCLTVARSGATSSYANGLWARVPAAAPAATITSLSCATATSCVATDQKNNVLFYALPQSG
jgi:hypothetical protein